MKNYQTNQIKNILLVGNSGSGKTSLSESMLFVSGAIDRKGDVGTQNTVSDYNLIEQENGNSMISTVMHAEHNDKKINFIDAPGLDDFVGGVISAQRVSDTALLLVNAQNGVEVGTEVAARVLKNFEKPMTIVVNHLDHDKANWEQTIESITESFGSSVVIAQYPLNAGSGYNSFIDLIKMKMYTYPAGGGAPQITDIPAEEADKAADLQNELIEKAAENDESLMELFFENDGLSEDEMRSGISAGLIQRGMFPVFCISAKDNTGVDRLMEFITNVLPSASDMPARLTSTDEEIICDSAGKPAMFVFKTAIEEHIGEINYFKVLSGEITEGLDLVNNTTDTKERISQIYTVAGKSRTKVSKLVAGDIGATVKMKNTKTNNTLTHPSEDFVMPGIRFPASKFRTAIKCVDESDDEKLGEALNKIHDGDPTVIVEYSKELKQIILHGQGEYHLNIVKWRLDHEFKIQTEFYAPKIPYRETITKVAQASYRHKKQSGGSGQFGEVHLIVQPYVDGMADPKTFKVLGKDTKVSIRGKEEHVMPWGGKLVFYNCIVGGAIDIRFLPAILKGLMERMDEGPLTGSYARDICVFVYDGKMHPVDSNEISFKLAGRHAFSTAFKEAGPRILEPVYNVDVMVPAEYMGDVISDLQGRRALVQGMSSEGGFEKVSAKVPLAEMGRYSTALSSITSGRAMFSMEFDEYAQVPGEVQDKLLKAYEAEQAED